MLHVITLPYPPSVNSIWRRSNKGIFLSKEARTYRAICCILLKKYERFGKDPVHVEIDVYPPDNRRRDIDNILKSVFDGLQHSGLIDDDSQIIRLHLQKKQVISNGKLEIRIGTGQNAPA